MLFAGCVTSTQKVSNVTPDQDRNIVVSFEDIKFPAYEQLGGLRASGSVLRYVEPSGEVFLIAKPTKGKTQRHYHTFDYQVCAQTAPQPTESTVEQPQRAQDAAYIRWLQERSMLHQVQEVARRYSGPSARNGSILMECRSRAPL